MIGIGRHTDYASRIVLHLALRGEGARATAADIAEQGLLPRAFVRRIVGRLAAAGILRTVRGARGGVALARPAAEISLLDIVNAMEGGLVLNPCAANPHACPLAVHCPVQKAWVGATSGLEAHLAAVRFDRLSRTTVSRRAPPGSGRGARRSSGKRSGAARRPG